ncbi:TIGR03086 family metal-binding protein [Actinomadura kijaniata]|uniref:TIGR03086 family metal-binding protein n=1 Tax=Actinomadura kijaniata TaxID=46161 RepID=UPI003F1CC92D
MELRDLMETAAEAAAKIVHGVPEDRLTAPTPNPEWDVRATVNHLFFWTRRAEFAARKQAPDDLPEEHDFTAEPGWADRFAEQARHTARAWRDPAAWEGDTSLTGATPGMPASVIGAMIFSEFPLHGWDLAVATGQPAELPAEVVRAAHRETSAIAEMARQYGAFGPEVPVADDAPLLDRLLGAAGRDPHWIP